MSEKLTTSNSTDAFELSTAISAIIAIGVFTLLMVTLLPLPYFRISGESIALLTLALVFHFCWLSRTIDSSKKLTLTIKLLYSVIAKTVLFGIVAYYAKLALSVWQTQALESTGLPAIPGLTLSKVLEGHAYAMVLALGLVVLGVIGVSTSYLQMFKKSFPQVSEAFRRITFDLSRDAKILPSINRRLPGLRYRRVLKHLQKKGKLKTFTKILLDAGTRLLTGEVFNGFWKKLIGLFKQLNALRKDPELTPVWTIFYGILATSLSGLLFWSIGSNVKQKDLAELPLEVVTSEFRRNYSCKNLKMQTYYTYQHEDEVWLADICYKKVLFKRIDCEPEDTP